MKDGLHVVAFARIGLVKQLYELCNEVSVYVSLDLLLVLWVRVLYGANESEQHLVYELQVVPVRVHRWLLFLRIVHVFIFCLRFHSLAEDVDGHCVEEVLDRVHWEDVILRVNEVQ